MLSRNHEASLEQTIEQLLQPGKGILAADESTRTILSRFSAANLPCDEANRRAYRELLFTTADLNQSISGVILFEETLSQSTQEGTPFAQYLEAHNMVPGIKVDMGVKPLANFAPGTITRGLDDLEVRLERYQQQGARFAKWRAVLALDESGKINEQAVAANAYALAQYAAICQNFGIVPIVEPELLMTGQHSIEACAAATTRILNTVFRALAKMNVVTELMLLKPNMVLPGQDAKMPASIEQVAAMTLQVLHRSVPASVAGIVFLSGGQSDEQAVAHLATMNQMCAPSPWVLSFSYGRALQSDCLKLWQLKETNVLAAQNALSHRARANAAATLGHRLVQEQV